MGIWNSFKTTILMAALMGLCLGLGYLIGGRNAIIPALILGGGMNILAYFFSDKIALATMGAKEITRDDDRELWGAVESLAQRAELPMPRVYISDMPAPNAFATGRNPGHSAVCVTAGLRQMLNRQELEGVLAHELGHIKHRDILISTIAATVAGAISALTYLAYFMGGSRDDEDRGNPLVALLMIIFAPIAATLIQLAISRSREYAADSFGAQVSGSPRGLANALRKLAAANEQIPTPVPQSQGHLFIVAPLTGREMASLFMTHPPIEKRIARLEAMNQ